MPELIEWIVYGGLILVLIAICARSFFKIQRQQRPGQPGRFNTDFGATWRE